LPISGLELYSRKFISFNLAKHASILSAVDDQFPHHFISDQQDPFSFLMSPFNENKYMIQIQFVS